MRPFAVLATPRGRFGLTAAAALAPLLVLWWLGSGPVIDILRPGTDWLAGQLNLAQAVVSLPTHDWRVDTGLERASGTEIGGVSLILNADILRRLLLGFPLFLALVAAPPRVGPIRTAAIGCAVLVVLFWLSACSVIFNDVAVILNHRSSLVTDNVPPPSFTVTRPALSGTAFFLSGLGMYLALQVLPLAAPIGLWAGLNPVGLKTLLLQPDGPAPSEDGEAPVRGD